jgi:hypothetical protein
MCLPWEGPTTNPFLGYYTMTTIAYSELLDRSVVGGAVNISYCRRAQEGQVVMPT